MSHKHRIKRRRPRFIEVGAIALSFGIGLGTSWWFTDGRSAIESPGASGVSETQSDPSDTPSPMPLETSEPGTPETVDENVGPLSEINPPPMPSFTEKLPDPLISVTEDDIVKTGSGEFNIADGGSEASGENPTRYRVEVEKELPFNIDDTAKFIDETLADPRGWGAKGKHAFQRVSDDSYDFRIVIATPDTVDELCAPLRTNGKVSCGRDGRATLNGLRWAVGVESFGDDIDNYRRYLVAHEFGHLLGYQHEKCPAPGELAPVMVQQTHSTQGCEPNPWPFPNAEVD